MRYSSTTSHIPVQQALYPVTKVPRFSLAQCSQVLLQPSMKFKDSMLFIPAEHQHFWNQYRNLKYEFIPSAKQAISLFVHHQLIIWEPGAPGAPEPREPRSPGSPGSPGAPGAPEPREPQTMNCNFAERSKNFTWVTWGQLGYQHNQRSQGHIDQVSPTTFEPGSGIERTWVS